MSDRFNWEQGYRQGKAEAADEIERLRREKNVLNEMWVSAEAEIERLRGNLEVLQHDYEELLELRGKK